MSSKALAEALLSYGADLKVKNIVMERFFSILPPLYMSSYRLFDPSDELVVDTLFRYTKQTLIDRGEYELVAQTLFLETYPDLSISDLKEDEISLLAELAIKRTVFRAIQKIYSRIYAPNKNNFPTEISNLDQDANKKRFMDAIVDKMFVMEKTNKISFLSKTGTLRKYYNKPESLAKFYFNPTFGAAPSEPSKYSKPKFCIEPFMQIQAKDASDMVLCTQDITDSGNEPAVIATTNALVKMVYFLATGEQAAIKEAKKITDTNFFDNISLIGGKTVVFSADDFESYWTNILTPELTQFVFGTTILKDVQNAIFKSADVGVRCAIDYIPDLSEVGTPVSSNERPAFFQIKSGTYEEGFYQNRPEGYQILSVDRHYHFVLAQVIKQHKPEKAYELIATTKEFNGINLKSAFSLSTYPMNPTVAETLLVDLFQTNDFDAIIKSVFNSALVFNTSVIAPNLVLANDIIPLMRQRGVFSGLDQALEGMFSSLQSYLLGSFPWSGDCGDLARLL